MIGLPSVRAVETSSEQRCEASESRETKNSSAPLARYLRAMISSHSAPPGMSLSNQTTRPRAFSPAISGSTRAWSARE